MFMYKHFVGGDRLSEIDDVMRNLSNVLRTKREIGYFRRDFGLSEVGFRTPEQMVSTLSAEIRQNIRLYEPRVELVDIDEAYDDAGQRAQLIVRLRLRSANERLQIVIDLHKNSIDVVPAPARAPR